MQMLFTLTTAESKRLIGKAVAELPEVKKALKSNKILISSGTTTGYVVEELLQAPFEKWRYPSGVVTYGRQCATPDDRIRSIYIDNGRLIPPDEEITDYEELRKHLGGFGADDVYIKGANAVDSQGNAGFLLAHPTGGNIAIALSVIASQGCHFIIPVGLEKMISSVIAASRANMGIHKSKYNFGRGCGYIAVTNGKVITEIEALRILTDVDTVHVASGGVGGSEGAVTLLSYGEEEQVDEAAKLIKSIKGEKPLRGWKKPCSLCQFKCSYQEE